jgi:DNA-binding IclR family transcriptional regulator
VLRRGVDLLAAFEPEHQSMGLAELARRTNLPKTTAHRLATQLVELGLLERAGNGYRLGIRLFELGSAVSRQRRLREAALPFMEDLYEATHETIHLGVVEGVDVLYIERIAGRGISTVETRVGSRKPLYCTGLGKAILSHSSIETVQAVQEAGLRPLTPYTRSTFRTLSLDLAEAARRGVAFDREEFALGLSCVASPLMDRSRQARAALSISGPTSRIDFERFAPAVRTAAFALARALNGNPWPS